MTRSDAERKQYITLKKHCLIYLYKLTPHIWQEMKSSGSRFSQKLPIVSILNIRKVLYLYSITNYCQTEKTSYGYLKAFVFNPLMSGGPFYLTFMTSPLIL